ERRDRRALCRDVDAAESLDRQVEHLLDLVASLMSVGATITSEAPARRHSSATSRNAPSERAASTSRACRSP
ncbi:hypothetical protein H7H73_24930, partial [Mycobacterium rufum]|nr:hypothetical protein [Mycolicibacterium rufum]